MTGLEEVRDLLAAACAHSRGGPLGDNPAAQLLLMVAGTCSVCRAARMAGLVMGDRQRERGGDDRADGGWGRRRVFIGGLAFWIVYGQVKRSWLKGKQAFRLPQVAEKGVIRADAHQAHRGGDAGVHPGGQQPQLQHGQKDHEGQNGTGRLPSTGRRLTTPCQ